MEHSLLLQLDFETPAGDSPVCNLKQKEQSMITTVAGIIAVGCLCILALCAANSMAIGAFAGWQQSKEWGAGFVARCSGALLGAVIGAAIFAFAIFCMYFPMRMQLPGGF